MAEETNTNNIETNVEEDTNKSYTQEEVDQMLQSEVDKRVTQAQKKWEKESSKKISEAEKLAKMNEEERYKYELEQKDKKLADRERELNIRQNKIEALKVMDGRKIPATLIDLIVSDDADVMMERINLVDEVIKEAVSEQVREKLKSPTPQTTNKTNTITKEDFRKMSIAKRQDLLNNNPKLYAELSKQ